MPGWSGRAWAVCSRRRPGGAITFGLVHVPVRAVPATEIRDPQAHWVHRADGGRIRHRRHCSICGQTVDIPDIGRDYPLGRGRHVVLDDRDLARLPLPSVRALDIAAFVPISDIDPLYFQRAYYLAPERAGLRPYVLLRDTLHTTARAGVGKVVLREREALAVLRARADVLVLHTVLWPDEIREPRFPFRGQTVAVSPDELEAAGALIEAMSGRIASLEEFTDEYREALHSLIDAKAAGLALPEPPAAPPQVEAAELMAVLERSVEQARARREDRGGLRPAMARWSSAFAPASNACSPG